jgi:hypothetical protein
MKELLFVTTVLLSATLVSSAYAGTPQQDGYHTATRYDQIKAYCEALSDKINRNTGAGLIRAYIDHSNSYDQCMTMMGFARNQ